MTLGCDRLVAWKLFREVCGSQLRPSKLVEFSTTFGPDDEEERHRVGVLWSIRVAIWSTAMKWFEVVVL
jgi:hypothetical protein